jgi:hypothetical protein
MLLKDPASVQGEADAASPALGTVIDTILILAGGGTPRTVEPPEYPQGC